MTGVATRRIPPPVVSILMPVRNAGRWVDEAVASLLAQTLEDWELIAIDDGSDDDTADRIAAFDDDRIRLTRGATSKGLPARLNQAVAMATGAFMARMDGDDVAYPERLERQVTWLIAHPLVDVVATDMLVTDAHGRPSGRERWRGSEHEDIVATPWSGFHFNHATWVGRAGWFRRHPYRPDAIRAEDDDLMLRSFRMSRFHRLHDVLYAYRTGPFDAGRTRTARRSFARSLAREGLRHRDLKLLAGIPLQWAKMGAEFLLSGTVAGGRLLRHRNDGILPEPEARAHAAAVARVRRYRDDRPPVERVRRTAITARSEV